MTIIRWLQTLSHVVGYQRVVLAGMAALHHCLVVLAGRAAPLCTSLTFEVVLDGCRPDPLVDHRKVSALTIVSVIKMGGKLQRLVLVGLPLAWPSKADSAWRHLFPPAPALPLALPSP